MSECPHAYKVKLGTGMYCLVCNRYLTVDEVIEHTEYAPCQMPPITYCITPKVWEQIAPWPKLPFDLVQKYGLYLSLLKYNTEYLIMPITRGGQNVFYSSRKIGTGAGPKYYYQTGAKRYYWKSDDFLASPTVFIGEGVADGIALSQLGASFALLGSHYDGSLDDLLVGKRVIIALDGDVPGMIAAVKIGSYLTKKGIPAKIATLPDGVDPTDCTADELKHHYREVLDG